MNPLPETILQFGAGRFLRAFADLFIHQANEEGQDIGRIVIVQSTGDERAAALNRQKGRYHVAVRGYENGAVVDRIETSASISRALVAAVQWDEVRAVARSPQLRIILSNTTESGYNLDPSDTPPSPPQNGGGEGGAPPRSFPAKLLALLRERFEARGSGLTIIPCELREHNADTLRRLLLQLARAWGLANAFTDWLETECVWLNTLVDRIVVDPAADHPLRAEDALLAVCEPYALWAIQREARGEGRGAREDRSTFSSLVPRPSPLFIHPAVVWTSDVLPYFLRKVRILNGAHSALLIQAWPRGFKTVREAVVGTVAGTPVVRGNRAGAGGKSGKSGGIRPAGVGAFSQSVLRASIGVDRSASRRQGSGAPAADTRRIQGEIRAHTTAAARSAEK
jgi:tagaturonate reductase